ncbi:hypothetical protein ACIU1J_09905 [Azospirillum doebereinerae]|uniref:hypothetical protein n=1 Tax=Azospirillum doebereinerae TaxID=92933 RepID=UPI00384D187B
MPAQNRGVALAAFVAFFDLSIAFGAPVAGGLVGKLGLPGGLPRRRRRRPAVGAGHGDGPPLVKAHQAKSRKPSAAARS